MLVFWTIAGVALALLILTAFIGDILDGVLESIDFTGGYLSSAAILSFLATFGLTGVIVLSTTDASTLVASLAGVGAGAVVATGVAFASRALARGATAHQITASDYVDQVATVTTSIPAGGLGQVHLIVAGQTASIAARAAEPIASGAPVRILNLLGPGVVKVTREG